MNVYSLLFLLIATAQLSSSLGETRVGFYSTSCPRVESIVQSTVRSHFNTNPTIAPGLLRMHFHDCFVQGCDGSILIDGANTEKTSLPNRNLGGFEVIDDAKTQLEEACPGIVSCADILALAARDSVVLSGGTSWAVPTGRRDGRVSLASETLELPSFRDSVDIQRQKYELKGLNTQDLVALSAGHTIGTSACHFVRYRLYNFNSTGAADPTIDPTFLPTLRSLCPENGDGNRRIGLDHGSANRFDNSFFVNLRKGWGVIESDQVLWSDPSTRNIVQRFLRMRGLAGLSLNVEFGKSMVKMSNIEIKSAANGEIRRVCSAIN